MTVNRLSAAAFALGMLLGSAGLASAQSTPNGSTATPGAPAGSNSGNAATGSGAAPSGGGR